MPTTRRPAHAAIKVLSSPCHPRVIPARVVIVTRKTAAKTEFAFYRNRPLLGCGFAPSIHKLRAPTGPQSAASPGSPRSRLSQRRPRHLHARCAAIAGQPRGVRVILPLNDQPHPRPRDRPQARSPLINLPPHRTLQPKDRTREARTLLFRRYRIVRSDPWQIQHAVARGMRGR